MRKLTRVLLLIFLLSLAPSAQAASVNVISNDILIIVVVDGKIVEFPDQQPYLDANNRTMVPVRFPAQTLGGKVDWEDSTQQVTITQTAHDKLPAAVVKLWIGKKEVLVDGATRTMDTIAVLTPASRTMVPVRFISEYLGAEVRWHNESNAAHVFTKGQSAAEQEKIMNDIAKEIEQIRPSYQTVGTPPMKVRNNPDLSITGSGRIVNFHIDASKGTASVNQQLADVKEAAAGTHGSQIAAWIETNVRAAMNTNSYYTMDYRTPNATWDIVKYADEKTVHVRFTGI